MKDGANSGSHNPSEMSGQGARDTSAQLPYISMPIPYTHPGALAGLMALYGIAAPPPETADVLELGCAGGGNIIPLAAQFPRAKFIGVDLSDAHVMAARQRIAALGLKNIEIRKGDIAKLRFSKEKFDYVLCHGVFSWVPTSAQKAILKICTERLTRNGVAAISYNVLPGWHLRNVIRDLAFFHCKKADPPKARADQVRKILAELAASVNTADPYGQVLAHEAKRIAGLPSSYILGEFLSAENTAYYFEEFAGMAAAHRLSYVCEGDLAASLSEYLMPSAAPRIAELAGSDPVLKQQYLDFFTGRTFRRSVLIRSQRAKELRAPPTPDGLRNLNISATLKADAAESSETVSAFKDGRARTVKAKDPAVRLALARLADAYPSMLTLDEMLAPVGTIKAPRDAASEGRVLDVVFKLLASGRANISTTPLRTGRMDQPRPKVWTVARAEAATGQPWVTSRTHHAVALNKGLSHLIKFIDGTRDRPAIAKQLALNLSAGDVKISDFMTGKPVPEGKAPSALDLVQRSLAYLAVNALLEPVP